MIQNSLNPNLDIAVQAQIPFRASSQAKAVVKALIPDNVNFPKGLSMRIFPKGSMLIIELSGKNVPTSTLLHTLDEVLEHISVAKKVMDG
ncbi:MAG: hypothetical protein M3258_00130 [Thermoproteota archaeon]|jgi:hypothetical protein|nr:hypothetical protein [Thermoproteota archaeon]